MRCISRYDRVDDGQGAGHTGGMKHHDGINRAVFLREGSRKMILDVDAVTADLSVECPGRSITMPSGTTGQTDRQTELRSLRPRYSIAESRGKK